MRPKAIPASMEITTVAATTSGSSSGHSARGIMGGIAVWIQRTTKTASPTPSTPASVPNVTLSVRS